MLPVGIEAEEAFMVLGLGCSLGWVHELGDCDYELKLKSRKSRKSHLSTLI